MQIYQQPPSDQTYQRTIRNKQYSKYTQQELLELFKDKPFWIKDQTKHQTEYHKTKGYCCFNHIVGLPTKDRITYNPIFDYELKIIDTIEKEDPISQKNRHIFILKAGGLGITELFLRYMLYLALTQNKQYRFTKMCIVVGPNMRLAIKLIKRATNILFNKLGFQFKDDNQSSFRLCNVDFEAYPSNNINGIRSLDNASFILVDEGDFFVKLEWREILDAVQRYHVKSKAIIALVSTPNKPGGMFQTLEQVPEEKSFYTRIRLDYKVGLNKIYSQAEIDEAIRTNNSFEREFNLKYLGKIGNVFSIEDIEACITEDYDIESTDPFIPRAAGIDEGFSSSATGIFIQQFRNKTVEVQYADQIENSTPTDIIQKMHRFTNHYHITKHYVDGSQPGFIRDFKRSLGEYEHYEKYTKEDLERKIYHGNMLVCPIQFGNQNDKVLLYHLASIIEKRMMKIHPKFDKFITSLKTAYAEDGDLDKEETSYDDILDAARLSVQNIRFTKQQ